MPALLMLGLLLAVGSAVPQPAAADKPKVQAAKPPPAGTRAAAISTTIDTHIKFAAKPGPSVQALINPATIPISYLAKIDTSIIRAVQSSFVKRSFDINQLYGWLTIADTKALAQQQMQILSTNLASDLLTRAMFDQYADLYGKTYETTKINAAVQTFAANLQTVVKLNTDASLTYWASCNQYCDIDFATFKTTVLLNNANTKPTADVVKTPPEQDPFSMGVAAGPQRHRRSLLQWPPSYVDWVAAAKTTPVKQQGGCGSCWAFAATAAIESSYLIGHPQPGCSSLDLSEQQLVNCVNAAHGFGGTKGCSGGWSQDAINYVKNKWQVTESRLSYSSGWSGSATSTCGAGADPTAPSGDYVSLGLSAFQASSLTESGLRSWIASRPTVIYFCVDNAFKLYGGGFYSSSSCGTCTNHAMLAVGYSGSYWKLKNSWGTGWGALGYAYVQSNAGAYGGKGPCGIHQNAIQATIAVTNTLGSKCPSPPPPRPPPPRPPPRWIFGPIVSRAPIISALFKPPPPPQLVVRPVPLFVDIGTIIRNPIVLGGRRLGEEETAAGGAGEAKEATAEEQQQQAEDQVLEQAHAHAREDRGVAAQTIKATYDREGGVQEPAVHKEEA